MKRKIETPQTPSTTTQDLNVFLLDAGVYPEEAIRHLFRHARGFDIMLLNCGQFEHVIAPELFTDETGVALILIGIQPINDMCADMTFWASRARQFKVPQSQILFMFTGPPDYTIPPELISHAETLDITARQCFARPTTKQQDRHVARTIRQILECRETFKLEQWETDILRELHSDDFPLISSESETVKLFVSKTGKTDAEVQNCFEKLHRSMDVIKGIGFVSKPRKLLTIMISIPRVVKKKTRSVRKIFESHGVDYRRCLSAFTDREFPIMYYLPASRNGMLFFPFGMLMYHRQNVDQPLISADEKHILRITIPENPDYGNAHCFFQSIVAFFQFCISYDETDFPAWRSELTGYGGRTRQLTCQIPGYRFDAMIRASEYEVVIELVNKCPIDEKYWLRSMCYTMFLFSDYFQKHNLTPLVVLSDKSTLPLEDVLNCYDQKYDDKREVFQAAEKMFDSSDWQILFGVRSQPSKIELSD